MADYKAICESTGVNNWKWAEYAGRAKDYLSKNQKPRIVNETELNDAIEFVAANPTAICETADGIARAALVKGYVAEAESIDTTIVPDKARDQVTLDYYSFRHLVPMTTGSSLNGLVNRFANDVLDVVSPWFCDHRFNEPPTAEQEPTLQAVINKVGEVKKQGKKPIVIFDMDDTLFRSGSLS